ncbi:MAG: 2OG-Fe(II) oxygenase [Phycisphaera sp.]|nr:2OG-Fe(II) oxygenase [Phycisphaera sp.]
MPSPEFLSRFGVYIARGVLDDATCADICGRMKAAARSVATVSDPSGAYAVDTAIRRTHLCDVSDAVEGRVADRIATLIPAIAARLAVDASDHQRPQFLSYAVGDHFSAHRDHNDEPNANPVSRARRISVVVFLNAQSDEPGDGVFGGGELVLYGLMRSPDARRVGFPIAAEPGLLVAFRSDTLHEVTPVTHGERFTVVTWLV